MRSIKGLFTIVFLIVVMGLGSGRPVTAFDGSAADVSAEIHTNPNDGDIDFRSLRLFLTLKQCQSPLTVYYDDFLAAADLWNIDWKLLPAITGLESVFGKRMVTGTHNAYGWAGGYQGFKSWRESIFYVSGKLKKNYYGRGLTDPYKIGPVYAPPNPNWGRLVASIMTKFE